MGLLDVPTEGPLSFDDYRGLTAEDAAEAIRAAKTVLGKRLVILVHHYQRDDVYQHADLTGDSFKLASSRRMSTPSTSSSAAFTSWPSPPTSSRATTSR